MKKELLKELTGDVAICSFAIIAFSDHPTPLKTVVLGVLWAVFWIVRTVQYIQRRD